MKSRLMLAAAAGALVATLAILPETAMAQTQAAATAPAKLSQEQVDQVLVYFSNDSVLPFHAPDFTKVPTGLIAKGKYIYLCKLP